MIRSRSSESLEKPAKKARTEEQDHDEINAIVPTDTLLHIFQFADLRTILKLSTSLSKKLTSFLESKSSFWRQLVIDNYDKNCDGSWDGFVEYAAEAEVFGEGEEELPHVLATGKIVTGSSALSLDDQLPIIEQQKMVRESDWRSIIESWVIRRIWLKILPLYFPNRSANTTPDFGSFFVFPDPGDDFWTKVTEKAESASECTIESFYSEVKDAIEDLKSDYRTKPDDNAEVDISNFPKGQEAAWLKLPEFLWNSTVGWPIVEWGAGEVGPWENSCRLFWGKKSDGSVIGFVAIVDNT